MPRDGSGVYSLASNTKPSPGDVVESSKFNTLVEDIEQDLNSARPVTSGGTGATSVTSARTALNVPSLSEVIPKQIWETSNEVFTSPNTDYDINRGVGSVTEPVQDEIIRMRFHNTSTTDTPVRIRLSDGTTTGAYYFVKRLSPSLVKSDLDGWDTYGALPVVSSSLELTFDGTDFVVTGVLSMPIGTGAQRLVQTDASGLIPTAMIDRSLLMPIGSVFAMAVNTTPARCLRCDGSSFDQLVYPDLYTALGNSNVTPDYRGRFIRDLDDGAGIDAGRSFGTFQNATRVIKDWFSATPSVGRDTIADGGFDDAAADWETGSDVQVYSASETKFGGNADGTAGMRATGMRVRPTNVALKHWIVAL